MTLNLSHWLAAGYNKFMSFFKKHQYNLFLVGLFFYLALFFLRPINLFTADLGRHLTNGREILAALPRRSAVFDTNYYSYTETNYPFINHHWFYGVLSDLIYRLGGFVGLELINTLIELTAIMVMLSGAAYLYRSKQRWWLVAITAFMVLPLVTYRLEIRPESISFLLAAVFYLVLVAFHRSRLRWRWLLMILLPLQILWVNTHIFWIFSFLITGSFLLADLVTGRWPKVRQLMIVMTLLLLASLINPFTWKLILFPWLILRHYGYQIVENQPLWFMWQRFHRPIDIYMFLLTFFIGLASLFDCFSQRWRCLRPAWLVMVVFLFTSWWMNRFIPFFGLFLIPVLLSWFSAFYQFCRQKKHFWLNLTNKWWSISIFSLLGFMLLILMIISGLFLPPATNVRLGLLPQTERLAQFIKTNRVSGPIFNNYDLGGYLIFNLYPKEKVFVDNRPEAYSADFLQKTYVQAQQSTKVWRALLEKYQFQSIIFYRLDQTPWAQPFLIERLKDKDWRPIYVDNYTLVLVRNNQKNQKLIKKFQLPKKMFIIDRSDNKPVP